MIGVIKVTDACLVATLHLPSQPGPHPVMIVLSGSGGGIALSDDGLRKGRRGTVPSIGGESREE